MSLYAEVATVLLVALALLYYVGYGVSKLLLPDELKEYEGLLTPFVGFGVIALIAYYSVNTVLNLTFALAIILGLATVANTYAAWRRPRGLRFDWRGEVPLLIMVLGVFAAGILPLLHHGYLTVIGESWDVEFYLPLAEYLKAYPQTGLFAAPANSAIRLLTTPPTSGRGMGLTYLHSLVSLITRWDALSTFAPVLSVMRALSLFPVYVFGRRTLGLSGMGALAACFFMGLSEPLLWVTFNNFAMHVGSLGLLPLLVIGTHVALAKRDTRSVGFAAFIFASLAVTYHPALTAYAVLGTALGVHYLLRERPRLQVLKAAGAIVSLGLILSFLAQIRFPDGFLGPYANRVTSLGIFSFAPLSDLYGLSFFFPLTSGQSLWLDLGSVLGGHIDLVAGGVTALAILLSIHGLWKIQPSYQRVALALAAACAVYLLVFRFITKSQYGFFKGATFISFVLWGLLALGLVHLWSSRWGKVRLPLKVAAAICTAALLAALGFNTVLLVAQYWVREPPLYGKETQELARMATLLPPKASVYLTGDPSIPKSYLGLVSYYLEGHETYGYFNTGFSLLLNPPPDRPPDYALLSSTDDPTVLGYGEPDLLWVGERLRLYKKDPTLLALFAPVKDDNSPRITITQSQTLMVLPNRIIDQESATANAPPQRRTLTLALASFTQQRMTVQIGDTRRVIDLSSGLTEYSTGVIEVPAKITLLGEGEEPVYLRWMALREANGGEPFTQIRRNEVFFQSQSSFEGDKATTRLKLATPPFGTGSQIIKLKASLDGRLATSREQVKIGDWEFWAGSSNDIRIETDLKGKGIEVFGGGQPLEVRGQGKSIPDGWYGFSLAMIRQNRLVGSRQLFVFEVKDGKVVRPQADDTGLAIIHLPTAQRELDYVFDGEVSLLGYTLDGPAYQATDKVRLTLYWRGLLPISGNHVVSVQLTDNEGHQISLSEGEPDGGRYRTSVWPSGEIVEDTKELLLPRETPAGNYWLRVGIYSPATRRWLSISGDGKELGIETTIAQITVRR